MLKTENKYRPSTIDPSQWAQLFSYAHPTTHDGWPIPGINIELLIAQRLGKEFTRNGVTAQPVGDEQGPFPMAAQHRGGPCDLCGAHHIYGTVFVNQETRECISLGWICADKLDLLSENGDRTYLRDQMGNRRDAVKRFRETFARYRALGREHGREVIEALRHGTHDIIRDIRIKARRFDLSEKQVALVLKLRREELNPAPVEVKVAVPEGKIEHVGTIQSVKSHESRFGFSLKMTLRVETEAGVYRVWGTVPSKLLDLTSRDARELIGRRVSIVVDATRSDRDEAFGFFKRPTKPKLLD